MRNLKRMFTSHMFRAGSYAAFGAALVIAIAVVVNLMAAALPTAFTQVDLTEQSLYSLSEQSKRIVSQVNQEVDLYLLSVKGQEDTGIKTLLDRYAALSDKIKVTVIDPNERPTFLNNYEISESVYANSVIVQSGDRYRFINNDAIYVYDYAMDYYSYSYDTSVTFNGEGELTSAIHYVTSADLPKVYALTGHGETALNDEIKTAIQQDNLELDDLSLLSMEAVPEDAQAVVINVPTSDLSQAEADILTAYLDKGGSVVLLTDQIKEGEMTNLLSLTAHMGMTLSQGMVVEGDSSMSLRGYSWYLLPEIASHDITQPLIDNGYYVLFPMAQPIVGTDSEASLTPLLTTSEASYAKAAGYDMATPAKEEGDAEGPFNVAVIATLGQGRMVWYTSP